MNNAMKVWKIVQANMLCDDCIAETAQIKTRQTVNTICIAVVEKIIREKRECPKCHGDKWVNWT